MKYEDLENKMYPRNLVNVLLPGDLVEFDNYEGQRRIGLVGKVVISTPSIFAAHILCKPLDGEKQPVEERYYFGSVDWRGETLSFQSEIDWENNLCFNHGKGGQQRYIKLLKRIYDFRPPVDNQFSTDSMSICLWLDDSLNMRDLGTWFIKRVDLPCFKYDPPYFRNLLASSFDDCMNVDCTDWRVEYELLNENPPLDLLREWQTQHIHPVYLPSSTPATSSPGIYLPLPTNPLGDTITGKRRHYPGSIFRFGNPSSVLSRYVDESLYQCVEMYGMESKEEPAHALCELLNCASFSEARAKAHALGIYGLIRTSSSAPFQLFRGYTVKIDSIGVANCRP